MEHARHVFRVALLLVVAASAFFIGRSLLVPASYGLYGSYRYDDVREQMRAREPLHSGSAACGECHPAQLKQRASGKHRTVSCEVCHGPKGIHVKADGSREKMPVDRSYALCARCHRKILGRPVKFPQVVLEQHVPAAVEGAVCLECHAAHSPTP